MKIKTSEIVKRVFDLLDENETLVDERVEYCDPDTAVKPLIMDLLPDAARLTLSTLPLSEIDETVKVKLKVEYEGTGVGKARLPEDFLRLSYVRMTCWPYGISEPLAFGGEEYRLRNGRKGLAARRRSSPAVAISSRGSEKDIHIFGISEGAGVDSFEYVEVPKISGIYIELPPGTVSAVCSRLAGMVGDVIAG